MNRMDVIIGVLEVPAIDLHVFERFWWSSCTVSFSGEIKTHAMCGHIRPIHTDYRNQRREVLQTTYELTAASII